MLTDEELLKKCTTNKSITCEDLGTRPVNKDGFIIHKEGLNILYKPICDKIRNIIHRRNK